jgi:hypothetical protein
MTSSELGFAALMVVGWVLAWWCWGQSRQLPVALEVCGVTDGVCFRTANFGEWQDCQRAAERGNWLCDQTTDPQKITCRPPPAETRAMGRCFYR